MNAPFQLATARSQYERVKAELIETHNLAETDPVLLDTLEGCTELPDMLAAMAARALECREHVTVLHTRIEELRERQKAWKARHDSLRAVVLRVMDDVGMPRLERPEFTLSGRWNKGGLIGLDSLDATTLPDRFCRIKREPNAAAIREALEAGETVEGVTLGNRSRSLAIR